MGGTGLRSGGHEAAQVGFCHYGPNEDLKCCLLDVLLGGRPPGRFNTPL